MSTSTLIDSSNIFKTLNMLNFPIQKRVCNNERFISPLITRTYLMIYVIIEFLIEIGFFPWRENVYS